MFKICINMFGLYMYKNIYNVNLITTESVSTRINLLQNDKTMDMNIIFFSVSYIGTHDCMY